MNILITGGSSGLGTAIVSKLALNKNNKIYFTFFKSVEKAKVLTDTFSNVQAIQCDFSEKQSVEELGGRLKELDIDVLINNAIASSEKEHFHKIAPLKFINSFQTNIYPTLYITQECIQNFRKKKFGKIITVISSYTINKPPAGLSEYVANKAYLLSMSKSWASENIRFNITSNCISPSYMQTAFTKDTDERVLEEMINSHPLKKLLTPEDVAESIVFLSSCSQQINGINLVINAGSELI